MYTITTLLWPFGSGSEAQMFTLLKYVFEQRHRIKKSQTRNCDTGSELQQKCKILYSCFLSVRSEFMRAVVGSQILILQLLALNFLEGCYLDLVSQKNLLQDYQVVHK